MSHLLHRSGMKFIPVSVGTRGKMFDDWAKRSLKSARELSVSQRSRISPSRFPLFRCRVDSWVAQSFDIGAIRHDTPSPSSRFLNGVDPMQTSKRAHLLPAAALCCMAVLDTSAWAQTTSDYRDFVEPYLLTYASSGLPPLTTVGPVHITNSPANSVFDGFSFVTGTPADPSDTDGWGAAGPFLPIILDFDRRLRAFGITFNTVGNQQGSLLSVYDGPHGTGNLIGQIQSVVVPPPWSAANQPIDFVGVIDNSQRILSAVLSATGTDDIQISAIALSIPEPSISSIAIAMLIGMAGSRYRRSS